MTNHKQRAEYKALSARAKALLKRSETFDVEFKESISGLESSDIVSFANSERGGAILIGIREVVSQKGQQRGEIIGCPIGDKDKLKILSKVNSCIPEISAEIFVENLNSKPFFRLEIPAGEDKPYCTSGGTYKIRGDGITQNLNPTQLLNIFITKESDRFLKHFREATNVLGLVKDLDEKIYKMDHDIFEMRKAITSISQKLGIEDQKLTGGIEE